MSVFRTYNKYMSNHGEDQEEDNLLDNNKVYDEPISLIIFVFQSWQSCSGNCHKLQ